MHAAKVKYIMAESKSEETRLATKIKDFYKKKNKHIDRDRIAFLANK